MSAATMIVMLGSSVGCVSLKHYVRHHTLAGQAADSHHKNDSYYHCPHCGQIIPKEGFDKCPRCMKIPAYYGYEPTCWRQFPDGWGCLPESVANNPEFWQQGMVDSDRVNQETLAEPEEVTAPPAEEIAPPPAETKAPDQVRVPRSNESNVAPLQDQEPTEQLDRAVVKNAPAARNLQPIETADRQPGAAAKTAEQATISGLIESELPRTNAAIAQGEIATPEYLDAVSEFADVTPQPINTFPAYDAAGQYPHAQDYQAITTDDLVAETVPIEEPVEVDVKDVPTFDVPSVGKPLQDPPAEQQAEADSNPTEETPIGGSDTTASDFSDAKEETVEPTESILQHQTESIQPEASETPAPSFVPVSRIPLPAGVTLLQEEEAAEIVRPKSNPIEVQVDDNLVLQTQAEPKPKQTPAPTASLPPQDQSVLKTVRDTPQFKPILVRKSRAAVDAAKASPGPSQVAVPQYAPAPVNRIQPPRYVQPSAHVFDQQHPAPVNRIPLNSLPLSNR